MYLDVKVGKKGEIVIPAQVRKRLNIVPGEELSLTESGNRIEIIPKQKDVLKRWRKLAEETGLAEEDLVYGDRLYEEVFS